MQYSISGPGGRPGKKQNSKINLLKFKLSKHCLIKHDIPNEMRRKKLICPFSRKSGKFSVELQVIVI